IMKDIFGHRLPKFTNAHKAKLKDSTDFVGLNYYTSNLLPLAAMNVYSEDLRNLLKYIKDNYANPEIMIMENGYGEELGATDSIKNGTADHNRKYYLQRHLLRYFIWSLLDNFEWHKNRFGLYYIDFKNNLTRHEKESAKYIIKDS
ncbi:hypothetical protein HID58_029055, partial [Brassica napus]